MSQNDLVIANQSFPATREDINSALQALGSSNSGTTEPDTIYANMFWYDTTAKILKLRSEANDAWISVGYFDQSANAFRILDDTQITNTSGTQTGLLGDQATATWEAGTGTTQSLVSPASIKSAFDAFVFGASDLVGADGYLTLSNGLIIQWTFATTPSGTTVVTYPTPFQNRVFFVTAQLVKSTQNYQSSTVATNYGTSLSSVTVYNDAGADLLVLAIGN
jgi:hypothetical protein